MRYTVEYRHHDWSDDDVYVRTEQVIASSAHEAIGIGWTIMQSDVESYGGTIDDLDAWEVHEVKSLREQLAHVIFCSVTQLDRSDWDENPKENKEPYYRAADQVILFRESL